MSADQMNDPQPERSEHIDDLDNRSEEVQNAEQVKGGFDPQPDPPGLPAFRPPVIINPGIIR